MKESSQEEQNKIYHKMSVINKLKIVDSFFKFARKLEQDKDPEVRVKLDD